MKIPTIRAIQKKIERRIFEDYCLQQTGLSTACDATRAATEVLAKRILRPDQIKQIKNFAKAADVKQSFNMVS